VQHPVGVGRLQQHRRDPSRSTSVSTRHDRSRPPIARRSRELRPRRTQVRQDHHLGAERLAPRGDDRDRLGVAAWSTSTTSAPGVGEALARHAPAQLDASAAAVASSSSDAPASSVPVRSVTMVWKTSSASSRPWLISGW
jgi:hypothetical protein